MNDIIFPFSKHDHFEDLVINSLGEDFALIQSRFLPAEFFKVFRPDCTIALICEPTRLCGSIGITSFDLSSPSLIILMPNQMVKFDQFNNDCTLFFIFMSKTFTDNLSIENRFSIFQNVHYQPCIEISQAEFLALLDYYRMLKKTILHKDPEMSLKIAKHLTSAFYYGIGYEMHMQSKNIIHNKKEIVLEKFIDLVQKNYNQHRHLNFYAEKLGMSSKYLSKMIKDNSGIAASDWIDNYIIAESKVLLKSTPMSIQQISDKMNFPSQTFFGKYFKRHTSMSPSQYRNHSSD